MDRRFERSLSQILSLLVLIVFIITIVSANLNVWVITYIWSVGFLISWGLMLIYALYVLMEKNSTGLSVFFAIITTIAFGLLAIPAIIVLARFVPGLPVGLTYRNDILNINSQFILYTSLIVVYFVHMINSARLRRHTEEYVNYSVDEEITELTEESFKTDNNYDIIKKDVDNITNSDKEKEEVIVYESDDNNEKAVYQTEEVTLVEELSEEDLVNLRGEEDNG